MILVSAVRERGFEPSPSRTFTTSVDYIPSLLKRTGEM